MAFLNTVITSRYPQTNNQLRTLSNPRNKATIQDEVIQNTGNATENQSNVLRCYNCKGEGRIARQWERVYSGTDACALTTTVIFHTDDVDAFDSDCDGAPNVQEMHYFEQPIFCDDLNIEITSDSNVISYDQYLKENKNEVVQSNTSPKQQDAMIMFVIDEMSNQVTKCITVNQENKIMNESLTVDLE
ncbi:hypothetical protein Tco_0689436 [Tanacetum coccineum]